jgi:hypothetical protein
MNEPITFQLIHEDLANAIKACHTGSLNCIFDCLISTAAKRATGIDGIHSGYNSLAIPREDEDEDEEDFEIDDDSSRLIHNFVAGDYPPITAAIEKGHTVTLTPW